MEVAGSSPAARFPVRGSVHHSVMAACARCGSNSGTAKFCAECNYWIKDQANKGVAHLGAYLTNWEAWEKWCSEHNQDPRV